VTHRHAGKSPEARGSRVGKPRTPPRLSPPLRSGSWRSSDLRRPHPTSCVRSCPLLSAALRSIPDPARTNTAQGWFFSGQVQPDLRMEVCWRWVGRPGAGRHPHGSAGARGECQDVRGLTSWQGGTTEGGGPTLGRATVMIVPHHLAPRPSPGRGQQITVSPFRSPGSRLPGPVGHICCPPGRGRS
jgi:hypothetical protein